jgi:hypothetical protein
VKKTLYVLSFILLGFAFNSEAHSYWIEFTTTPQLNKPLEVRLYYGEYAFHRREKGHPLDKMKDIRVWVIAPNGDSTFVETKQTDEYWVGYYTPKARGEFQVLGINDTRGVQNWHAHKLGIALPKQYLRKEFTLSGTAGSLAVHSGKNSQFLDMDITKSGDEYLIMAKKGNRGYREAKVTIINPEGWMQVRTTDRMGNATFKPNKSGMYLIETEWFDETPGTNNGIAYERVTHKMDTTIEVLVGNSL